MNTKIEKIYSSVVEGAEALALVEISAQQKGDVIYVARDDKRLARVVESLRFFAPDIELVTLPAWDCLPYDRVSPNSSVMSRRVVALSNIINGGKKKRIIATTVNSVIQKIPPLDILHNSVLQAAPGDEIPRSKLTGFLVGNGYINAGKVNEPGEYAMRGSIVDIFPPGEEGAEAYRLDFFGDKLESIRWFNPLTQISGRRCDRIDLIPASEILLDDTTIERFRKNYREMFGAASGDDPLYEAISDGRKYAGMEHWLPLFYERLDSLFDCLPDAQIIFDHLADEAFEERDKQIEDYYDARKDSKTTAFSMGVTYHPVAPELLYVTSAQWKELLQQRQCAEFSPFSRPDAEEKNFHATISLVSEAKKKNIGTFELLKTEIDNSKISLLACASHGSRERMKSILENNDIGCALVNDFKYANAVPCGELGLVVLSLEHGFESEEIQLFSEQDVLGEKIIQSRKRKLNADNFMEEAANLDEGELVVHIQHGIGRFEGLETLTVAGSKHDCLRIIYEGNDRLFVPIENIDVISRYGGGEEGAQLDRLGGLGWQKRTAKLKERIKVSARELIDIAAARQIKPADKFFSANGAYQEFSSKFPYEETEDQMSAIQDVMADLESGHPMDRLICGDVGFGKTEVALRAAFLAAHGDGEKHGQVAVITPTTLLARQHYQEFTRRFKDFAINVRQLSRLVPNAEASKIKHEIAEGKVDVVIGTHALLSKEITFKKLSLLIIDEEQHFGVKQKEHLKKLRAQTHVLTMTATPIPRTLQLSLTGVRDLSLITTPPVDRLAIRTYVMPFDQVVIREAILREHYRGGRSFYVCPRISDLEEIEKNLRKLVPEIKIVVAHGQMPPKQLDDIMNAFYDGAYDLLLSTTIIESGIDIPEANTLIVHKADMFGLAQLYQLRGRVGRSNVRAYAYLTLPPRRRPTKQALKRLEVMQTLDTLGAGFTLASYDMDIRGFGNLLGDEQSGNIKEVGVELYQQMLKEAVENLRAEQRGEEQQEEKFSPHINIGVSVLIPEDYVADLPLRLGLYRRIGYLETEEQVEAMAVELADRFGPLPDEVKHLLEVVKLKQLCRNAGIEKLDVGEKGTVVVFHNNKFANPEALINYINSNRDAAKVLPDQSLVLSHGKLSDFQQRLKIVTNSLLEVAKLAA